MWKAWPPAGSSASQPRPSYAGFSLFSHRSLLLVFPFPFHVAIDQLPSLQSTSSSFNLFHSKSLVLAILLVFEVLGFLFFFFSLVSNLL